MGSHDRVTDGHHLRQPVDVRGSDRAVIVLPSEGKCAMFPQLGEAAPRAFLALTEHVDVPELAKTSPVACAWCTVRTVLRRPKRWAGCLGS
jgi:hypothetical protein